MYKTLKRHRNKRKQDLANCLGGKCARCSYNTTVKALDFHHIDPTQKSFTISQIINKDLSLQLEEIKKCVLLCANCHRELHAGIWNIEDIDIPKFIDKITKEKIKDIKKECSNCKTVFFLTHRTRLYCSEKCSGIGRRKIERPSREELQKLVWEKPSTQIAKQYGVSDRMIGKWCEAYNISKPPRGYWTGK